MILHAPLALLGALFLVTIAVAAPDAALAPQTLVLTADGGGETFAVSSLR
jgi:hypothetical protein